MAFIELHDFCGNTFYINTKKIILILKIEEPDGHDAEVYFEGASDSLHTKEPYSKIKELLYEAEEKEYRRMGLYK